MPILIVLPSIGDYAQLAGTQPKYMNFKRRFPRLSGSLPWLRGSGVLAERWHPWIARLSGLLVVLLAAWILTRLAWQLLLPSTPPAPPLPGAPSAVARRLAGSHPYGLPATGPAAADLPGSHDYRLLGLIAASGTAPGSAILLRNGETRPRVIGTGEELAPGLILQRTEQRAIWLSREGVETRLVLPEPTTKKRNPE